MYDAFGLPRPKNIDVQYFCGNSTSNSATAWTTWRKPRGSSMCFILMLGAGGGGRSGAVGAASTAAGGGGGGSGAQSTLLIPMAYLNDILYMQVPNPIASTGTPVDCYCAIISNNTARNDMLFASSGSRGSAGSGAIGGAGGSGGTVATISNCPLAGFGIYNFIGGQTGTTGGGTGNGVDLTLPTTGLICTGGTGGGGVPAANTAGSRGGNFVVPATTQCFSWPAQDGGAGGTTAPTAGSVGKDGLVFRPPGFQLFSYGGTGGGSCGLSATPTGANGGNGGVVDAIFGSGGGGGGGAFTGSTAGVSTNMGTGLVVVISW